MGKKSREKREKRLQGEIEPKKEESEFGLEKILKGIIFLGTGLILFTPLIFSPKFFFPFVGPKSLYFMGLAQVIFFTWLFLIIFYPKYRLAILSFAKQKFGGPNLLFIALFLFLVIFIFASLLGIDPSYSFWSKFERMTGVLMLLHLFAFFLVIFSTFQEKHWIRIFAVSIFVGVILSFIALVSEDPAMRGGATIGNDSFLGTYLIFNLFLALYLTFRTKGGLQIYSAICFSIMALTIFLSDARAAKLSFLVGLILIFFLWLIFQKKGIIRLAALSVLILAFISAFYFVYLAFQPGSFVQEEIIKKPELFGTRFMIWEGAWQHIKERPLLGLGPENFEIIFPKYLHPLISGGEIWYDRAHNIIFDTLLSTGFLGLLSYFFIFFSVFYILWRGYLRREIGFWTPAIFSAMLISYFVQNLTVFDMVSSYMMFFLVLGFVANFGRQNSESFLPSTAPQLQPQTQLLKISLSRKKQLFGVLILLLIIFIFSFNKFVIQPLRTDFYTIKAMQFQSPKERIFWYQKTLNTSPLGKYQIREHFAQFTLEFGRSEKVEQFPREDYKSELNFVSQELEKTIKESPLNYRSYLMLGDVYNAYALIDPTKLDRAEEVLKSSIELVPTSQKAYWSLAQTKLYQGKFPEAFSLAEKALEMEKRIPMAHLIVIQVAKLSGDDGLAKRKAEEAIKIIPDLEPKIKKILEEN